MQVLAWSRHIWGSMLSLFYSQIWYSILLFVGTIFLVSAKCSDPWNFEFMILNTGTSNEWTSSISLDLNFRGFSYQRNPWKIVSHKITILAQYVVDFYDIIFLTAASFDNKKVTQTKSICIEQLEPYTMYRFYIRAYSENAAGIQSEIVKIQTSQSGKSGEIAIYSVQVLYKSL